MGQKGTIDITDMCKVDTHTRALCVKFDVSRNQEQQTQEQQCARPSLDIKQQRQRHTDSRSNMPHDHLKCPSQIPLLTQNTTADQAGHPLPWAHNRATLVHEQCIALVAHTDPLPPLVAHTPHLILTVLVLVQHQ